MERPEATGKYYCPMHCEGDKTYDHPGNCPVCGMHLVKEGEPASTHVAHPRLAPLPSIKRKGGQPSSGQYYCPMLCEGDKKYSKPGNCPVCGMHLVKEISLQPEVKEYTC